MVKKAPRRTAERILEVTLELFNRFGEPNVSTTLISAELGMKHYERAYPKTDIVLIEADHHDPELYLANTFSYGQRRQLAEHAYQQTRAMLRSRRTTLAAKLARHGIELDGDVLDDPRRHLVAPRPAPTRIGRAIASLQEVIDDLGHLVQPAVPTAPLTVARSGA